MTSPLHRRLAGALFLLLLLFGGFQFLWSQRATRLYHQEVHQTLNRDLATHVAEAKHETLLSPEGVPRGDGLMDLFHWLMVVNPNVEFYLLDLKGKILAYDAMPGKVKREAVNLAPVRAFLEGGAQFPLFGDDPRHATRRKVFSVAQVPPDAEPQAYLYVVLTSELYQSAIEGLEGSYALRQSAWMVLAALLLAGVVGFLLFRGLTGPLRRLAGKIEEFKTGEGSIESGEGGTAEKKSRDEVRLLNQAFSDMAGRIRKQVDEMTSLEAQRRELITNVSHDLRTPIAALQGYLDTLVLKKADLSPAERDEYLGIALRQSERLGKLVQELFELTKLESEAVKPHFEAISIAELVQDNVQRYRLPAADKGVDLEATLATDLPFVRGDVEMLERVLENLIENAVRFTPPGGRVSVGTESVGGGSVGTGSLGKTRHGGSVRVRISDTGCGISEDELPHIFDRFYRCQFSSQSGNNGAGLGLAISHRILTLHGTEFEVDSEVGRGTTFGFELPVFPLPTPS